MCKPRFTCTVCVCSLWLHAGDEWSFVHSTAWLSASDHHYEAPHIICAFVRFIIKKNWINRSIICHDRLSKDPVLSLKTDIESSIVVSVSVRTTMLIVRGRLSNVYITCELLLRHFQLCDPLFRWFAGSLYLRPNCYCRTSIIRDDKYWHQLSRDRTYVIDGKETGVGRMKPFY